jgi:RNA polymerase primary sigma factor
LEAIVATGSVAVMVPDDAGARSLLDAAAREGLLDQLSEREQDIVRLRFGLNGGKVWTCDEVGEKYGVTGERIRQIEAKALATLRLLDGAHLLGENLEGS